MFHLYCFLTHLLAFSEHHRLPTPGLGLDTFAYLCPLGGNGYFLTINSSYPSFTVQYFEFGSLSVINFWRSRVALLFRVSWGSVLCFLHLLAGNLFQFCLPIFIVISLLSSSLAEEKLLFQQQHEAGQDTDLIYDG